MIKIINYKAGNAPSVLHACEKLGFTAEYAESPETLKDATRIVLPGVGNAKATMESLGEMGLIPVLEELVLQKKVPFLGICVGLQILFEHSAEEDTSCLGWLKGKVVKFDKTKVCVPQMGWNEVKFTDGGGDYFYFVNSYYAVPADKSDLWGECRYGEVTFAASANRGNIYGTQFHCEKSGEAGLALFKKFLETGGMKS